MVTISPTAGSGKSAPSPRQAMRSPLRLMFSVFMSLRIQIAGELTWHRSLMSMRGFSRRLIFFIWIGYNTANLALNFGGINTELVTIPYSQWLAKWFFRKHFRQPGDPQLP